MNASVMAQENSWTGNGIPRNTIDVARGTNIIATTESMGNVPLSWDGLQRKLSNE